MFTVELDIILNWYLKYCLIEPFWIEFLEYCFSFIIKYYVSFKQKVLLSFKPLNVLKIKFTSEIRCYTIWSMKIFMKSYVILKFLSIIIYFCNVGRI